MRIFNLIALIILLAHWNGCLQFMIPMFQNFPSDCWVALNGLQTAPWTEQYTVALFKALSHMLCIGYGRYPPQSYVDMWLTMLSMGLSLPSRDEKDAKICFSDGSDVLRGDDRPCLCPCSEFRHVSTVVQRKSKDWYRSVLKRIVVVSLNKLKNICPGGNYREKWEIESPIITNIDFKERSFMKTQFSPNSPKDSDWFVSSLLSSLQSLSVSQDVINYNCRSLVSSVPFFTNADPNFVSDVVTKLRFEVFQPGDQIIHEGTIGDKMYFIQEGVVDIIKSDGQILTTLSDGSYFGGLSFFFNDWISLMLNRDLFVDAGEACCWCSLCDLL